MKYPFIRKIIKTGLIDIPTKPEIMPVKIDFAVLYARQWCPICNRNVLSLSKHASELDDIDHTVIAVHMS
jgi:hypothetical protein